MNNLKINTAGWYGKLKRGRGWGRDPGWGHLGWSLGGCLWEGLAEKLAAPHTDAHSAHRNARIVGKHIFWAKAKT